MKKRLHMDTHVLLGCILIVAAIITWLIPAGSFEYEMVGTRRTVIANSYHAVLGEPATVWDVFRSFPYGLYTSAILIAGLYCIGGFGEILIETQVVDTVIAQLSVLFSGKTKDFILISCFYFFSVLGAFLGLIDIVIPFVPIMMSLSLKLGYDSKTGIAVAIVGAMTGFMAGPTNPLTTGIGQQIAGIAMFSGWELRMLIYAVSTIAAISMILVKAHQNETKGILFETKVTKKMSKRDYAVLFTLIASILFFVIESMRFSWGNLEMATVLFIDAMLFGLLENMPQKKWIESFTRGASKMTGSAILIGLAAGVEWLLQKAGVLDTIVYVLLGKTQEWNPFSIILFLFLSISLLNFLIPSASGKAVLVMPMLIPVAQLCGFNEQIAVLIYQFGDGITKMIFPTVGPLLAVLAMGNIGFDEWTSYIKELVIGLSGIAVLFLAIAYHISYT